ncbi:MAG: hypothetical protein MUF83_09965 [Acidimicrobiales bacterium]|jgi:hypothetical protein|nr:hypothetical protein [Acidimicrobiales bacterium]
MDLVLFAEVVFGLSLLTALALVARNSVRARRRSRARALEDAARERELRRRMMANLGSTSTSVVRPVRIPVGAGAAGADAANVLLGLRSNRAA